jgi:hypothetical protein
MLCRLYRAARHARAGGSRAGVSANSIGTGTGIATVSNRRSICCGASGRSSTAGVADAARVAANSRASGCSSTSGAAATGRAATNPRAGTCPATTGASAHVRTAATATTGTATFGAGACGSRQAARPASHATATPRRATAATSGQQFASCAVTRRDGGCPKRSCGKATHPDATEHGQC